MSDKSRILRDLNRGVLGSVPQNVQRVTQEQLEEKVASFAQGARVACDSVFDNATADFLIKGKHPTIIGEEIVVRISLANLLMMFAMVIPVHIIPVLTGQIKVATPKATS